MTELYFGLVFWENVIILSLFVLVIAAVGIWFAWISFQDWWITHKRRSRKSIERGNKE